MNMSHCMSTDFESATLIQLEECSMTLLALPLCENSDNNQLFISVTVATRDGYCAGVGAPLTPNPKAIGADHAR